MCPHEIRDWLEFGLSALTRSYRQECCQGSDANAFKRCHTGISGAVPELVRSALL
jgi:hypothetical protein